MRPAHRHFPDLEAALERDEQDLWIESPALDGLQLEHGLGRVARERLEPALRIGEREVHHHAREQVKAAPEDLPVERLAVGLAAGLEPARTDRDVGSLRDGGEKALGLLD